MTKLIRFDYSYMLSRPQREDWGDAAADHLLTDAASEQMAQSRAAMRRHRDEVGTALTRPLHNRLRGIVGELHVGFDPDTFERLGARGQVVVQGRLQSRHRLDAALD